MDCIVQKSFCVLYLVFSIYITGPVMVVLWYNGKCEMKKKWPDVCILSHIYQSLYNIQSFTNRISQLNAYRYEGIFPQKSFLPNDLILWYLFIDNQYYKKSYSGTTKALKFILI